MINIKTQINQPCMPGTCMESPGPQSDGIMPYLLVHRAMADFTVLIVVFDLDSWINCLKEEIIPSWILP